jgi:hypothetical protein
VDFFFLNGDANRDRIVNTMDFTVLAANFGQSGKKYGDGDFSFDGIVNSLDFNALASSFGKQLSAPAGPEPMAMPQSQTQPLGSGGQSVNLFSTTPIDDDLSDLLM